jgi:hypothetical protein
MADLGERFDSSTVEPRTPFEPLPALEHVTLQIIDSEIKDTNAGTGRYVNLTMELMDTEYEGRKIWERLNIWNPSEKAVEISKATLSAICRATGVGVVTDTEQLHWQPMAASITCSKNKDGKWENRITYHPREDAPAAAAKPAAVARPAPTAGAAAGPAKGGAKPWERKRA